MYSTSEGFMGKNNPENLFSRLGAERAPFGAEKRLMGGSDSRTLESRKLGGVDFGDAIGKELQNLYDDVVAQPVPDRFLSLLNQLEKSALSLDASPHAPRERE
jgi:hypothetical protein